MPDDAEPLLQGDLISDIPFPQLGGELRAAGGRLALDVDMRPAIVVSQSCTIQNQRVAAVAPLRLVEPPDAGAERTLRNPGPGRGPDNPEGQRYVFHQFALEPHPHLPPEAAGQVRVADLCGIVSLSGDLSWLRDIRLGRMSVEGRRMLRYNLATFWGRTTVGDAQALADGGGCTGTCRGGSEPND